MADAFMRREARQRKILANSQARLQRISGQISADGFSGDKLKTLHKPSPPVVLNGATRRPSVMDSRHVRSEFEEELSTSEANVFRAESMSQSKVLRDRDLDCAPIRDLQDHVCEDIVTSDHHASVAPSAENTPVTTQGLTDLLLTSFLVNRWIYVIVAAIVNVLIMLRAKYSFGMMITIPFSLVFFGRIYRSTPARESRTTSLFIAALLLCNVRADVIHRLTTMSSLCSSIICDFSFYLFNFVLMYYFATSHWHNLASLTTNSIDILIGHHSDI